MSLYKDYPLCHALAAGHAAENSIPAGAYEFLAKHVVPQDHEYIWQEAEKALTQVVEKKLGLSPDPQLVTNTLYQLGYDSAAGGDDPEGDYVNIDKQLGIDDPAITLFADSLY